MSTPIRYKVALASIGLVGVLVACEHAHYWKNGEPWDRAFIKDMSDPEKAKVELARRMSPRAESGKYESKEAALAASAGCVSCHGETDHFNAHPGDTPNISCIDCHGGDGTVKSPLDKPGRPGGKSDGDLTDEAYLHAMSKAHVQPRNPEAWYGHPTIRYGDHHSEGGEGGHAMLHGSRTPEATSALLNQESPEFIRFINPGDLRVADWACGACHAQEVAYVNHSMMKTGCQLWGAALYNNGIIPNKIPAYGESYNAFGIPERLQGVVEADSKGIKTVRKPTDKEMKEEGVIPWLNPLPVWAISEPGNILRVFERGTKLPVPGGAVPNEEPGAIGLPNPLAEGGKADKGLSPRGLGTKIRTDPVFLGLQKTRLLDPILSFQGTNDHPGDFRASGCGACHTAYANDRQERHSGKDLAAKGNTGHSFTVDPTIPKNEPGHPVSHVLSNAIPTSQCIVCHIHPGTSYANTYTGYMWWDLESDAEFMYPDRSAKPTDEQRWESLRKNPDDAAIRGLWGNLYPYAVNHKGQAAGENFLEKTGSPEFNAQLKHTQFADFHGHGWMFRGVQKKDRHGNLLDEQGDVIDPNDPEKWKKAVHLGDIHLTKYGMQCVDCHFKQDMHGNGKLYGEVRNAVEIRCQDCHGDYSAKATLRTSGPAAPRNEKGEVVGTDLSKLRAAKGKRFEWKGGKLIQRSVFDPSLVWTVTQTIDTINPDSEWAKANPDAAKKSRYAKTVYRDASSGQVRWGDSPKKDQQQKLAHNMDKMECFTCHTSWMTSCAGCHLPMAANERAPMLHNESLYARNYTRYNFQVLRDDTYQLGRDSAVKGGKIVPVRSSTAVIVSSQNLNREWIYHQQQTISGEGYSGQTFNPHFPHATGAQGTTKMCTDCHVSRSGDNNAWMAQLLLQGTNMVNFFGRQVYVAEGRAGLEGVVVTEHDEPQAVLGSYFQSMAWPDEYKKFVEDDKRELKTAYHHDGKGALGWFNGAEVLDLQHRGEYLYVARGKAGFNCFDIQAIDNKGFSERIVTSPVSPLGQNLGFSTRNCVAVASPTTLGVDPARTRMSSDPSKPRAIGLDEPQPWHVNQETRVHPIYAYLYIADAEEGLIMTFAGTLLDGDPTNNFMERAKLKTGGTAFNPDGLLTGFTHLTLAGHYVYCTSPQGLVIIDVDDPTNPKLAAHVGSDVLKNPQAVAVQFRYAFVTDEEGLKVFDVTQPEKAFYVQGSALQLPGEKHRLYVARSYAYVAAGSAGVAIVDVTSAEKPALYKLFNAGGELKDTRDVKVGMTNASMYAYVADGNAGFKVLQLMGPNTTPQFRGFIPPLDPQLIAWRKTDGPCLAISKGLDRDRAVDESGFQTSVFGRLGARPMNLGEQQRMYLHDGQVWTVTDEPESAPEAYTLSTEDKKEGDKADAPAGGPKRRR